MRIAIGQISSESNHFVTATCELDFFRKTGFLYEGQEVFDLRQTGGELGGMLSVLDGESDVEVVPLLAARANSAGPLSPECYSHLRRHLLESLEDTLPLDGVLLSNHGSMAAANEVDPEGDIAAEVRKRIGKRVPLLMTLDLHGNVTRRMVEACDAILGYEQYPHRDVFQTGARAATLMLRILRREVSPVMTYAKLPMLVTAFHGTTQGEAPFGRLMREAKALEREPGILTTSLFFVGSYIDVPEMGSGALVVTDGDVARSVAECQRLARNFWRVRTEFSTATFSVREAVQRGRAIEGPILLLDTADTTGGGATGDGAGLIRELMQEQTLEPTLVMVVDPEAAALCRDAGVGSDLNLFLGHKLDPQWGTPVPIVVRVERVFEGRFQYTGGILGGSWATMGLSTVARTGGLSILIASNATYDWADEQYRCAGLDPRAAKFIGVKNMMNFRYGYGDHAKAWFVLDLPGPTPADMRMLPFRRVGRPVFPLDDFNSEPEPRISQSRAALEARG